VVISSTITYVRRLMDGKFNAFFLKFKIEQLSAPWYPVMIPAFLWQGFYLGSN